MAETQTQTQHKTEDPKTGEVGKDYRKEAEKRQKESDDKLKKFQDEDRKQDLAISHEDDFKKIGEKLSKARDRFIEIEALAADPTDPNIDQLRDIRTRANRTYQTLLDEINKRANLDINKR